MWLTTALHNSAHNRVTTQTREKLKQITNDKMSTNNEDSEPNADLTHIYNDNQSYTVPELFLLVLLVVMFLIGLLLCLESTDCVQKLVEERKRLRKALQYKPSEELSRVSPWTGDDREVVITPFEDVTKDEDNDNGNTDEVVVTEVKKLTRSATAPDPEIENL